ncbi:hypothetical protein Tco_0990636 [Tanacetum coccineum]|uniref:Retrovirus-related Pol polyprotein from transposon TNT 1-94 n=1 Tax=Tanacetum coccineum TaxID=301880 RepID=A0ABQ5EYD6_9ASTR
MAMDDLLQLVKKGERSLEGLLKKRHVVLSDSEEEEPEAQGRKSQDDPLDSSVQGLVTEEEDLIQDKSRDYLLIYIRMWMNMISEKDRPEDELEKPGSPLRDSLPKLCTRPPSLESLAHGVKSYSRKLAIPKNTNLVAGKVCIRTRCMKLIQHNLLVTVEGIHVCVRIHELVGECHEIWVLDKLVAKGVDEKSTNKNDTDDEEDLYDDGSDCDFFNKDFQNDVDYPLGGGWIREDQDATKKFNDDSDETSHCADNHKNHNSRCIEVLVGVDPTDLESSHVDKGCDAALETLPTDMEACDALMKKAYNTLILCLGDESLANRLGDHIAEFNKLILDLTNIDIEIEDEDQALMLLTSLPSSYENFVETFLYGRESLTTEDVLACNTLKIFCSGKVTEGVIS